MPCHSDDDGSAVRFRVELYSLEGEYVGSWAAHKPSAVATRDGLIYIAEFVRAPTPRPHLEPDMRKLSRHVQRQAS